ncbi:metalloendopeptidase [Hahella sp. CCB-MM4]|uniref:pre-peptidase C-terminal domain-containing protein n=1 Tax=Hahella sp. (strain CCB-MM4) TaxID=1926491 RepID=UPI000B9C73B7|nr:pre-peptidase C-terminal domain-containing protein [Hahella sp. CCB-MM4]OZG69747.1 metalloendopeptidase [Hahella sp. CCB-MM4]
MKKTIGPILTCALTLLPNLVLNLAHADDQYAPISDDQFIYSYQEMLNFDVEAYLQEHAPHLADKAEIITHWAGYSTVSPKVLLTMIEMKTGLLSQNKAAFMMAPMGDLSSESGFSEQVEDIASTLATSYYQSIDQEQSNLSFAGEGFAAQSLSTELRNDTDGDLDKFQEVYHRLFPETQEDHQFQSFDGAPSTGRFAAYSQSLVPPANMFQLPYPVGEYWYFGGAHTYTGSGSYPLSSLDFNNGGYWGSDTSNKWAVAAAGGTAIRHSSCFVEVLHEGGWSTTYYHLDNIQFSNRQSVSRNQKLANYANNRSQALCDGGSSTGPHQHFSLKYNGSYYHLDGVSLSGYQVKTGRNSYDSDCNYFWLSKDGAKHCSGRSLYNSGTSGSSDPTDPTDPDPDNGDDKELNDGDVIRNLSARKGNAEYYVMDVPAGARNLYFRITGGSGDMDMHIKRGSRPTLSSYDCRPYKTTQEEVCYYQAPQAGRYYVMLHAFSNYSGITLDAGYDGGQNTNREMSNGQVYRNLSGNQDEKANFYVRVPSGATNLRIEMSGGQGDADMHVMYNSQPTLNNYHCRPYKTTQTETCFYSRPYAGTYYIMLNAFKPYSGVQLVARYNTSYWGRNREVTVNLGQMAEER